MPRSARLTWNVCLAIGLLVTSTRPSFATEWFVASGGTGNGTATAPFGRIQDAISASQPGDVVTVSSGTFYESLTSVRNGSGPLRITVRAASGRGSVVVTAPGRVLTVGHAYFILESLVLDGQYGPDDAVRVTSTATGFTLRNSEVRRSGNDAIDMGGPDDVLIDGSLIHHALNPTGGRTDAHGIVAGAVHRLTIRDTEIHTFSGDGIQVDAGRAAPGWNDVLIEGCRIWLAPIPSSANGFPAGTVTGENALDTKSSASYPRARIVVRDTETFGFRNGLITNMAAFNLKENVDALLDGVLAHDSEIAFRLRGPGTSGNGAWVRIQNSIVHDVAYGFRYEDNIENLRIWNDTIGRNVSRPFYAASSSAAGLDVQNLLLLGSPLPPEAAGSSNLAVDATSFADATAHNYQLVAGSPAIDTAVALAQVSTDAVGTPRPQGSAYDVGAYERIADVAPPPPAPPPPPPSPSGIALTAMGYKVKGKQAVDLNWAGASSTAVDVYRNGTWIATTPNDGVQTDPINRKGGGTYSYTVCEAGTATCSNVAVVVF